MTRNNSVADIVCCCWPCMRIKFQYSANGYKDILLTSKLSVLESCYKYNVLNDDANQRMIISESSGISFYDLKTGDMVYQIPNSGSPKLQDGILYYFKDKSLNLLDPKNFKDLASIPLDFQFQRVRRHPDALELFTYTKLHYYDLKK